MKLFNNKKIPQKYELEHFEGSPYKNTEDTNVDKSEKVSRLLTEEKQLELEERDEKRVRCHRDINYFESVLGQVLWTQGLMSTLLRQNVNVRGNTEEATPCWFYTSFYGLSALICNEYLLWLSKTNRAKLQYLKHRSSDNIYKRNFNGYKNDIFERKSVKATIEKRFQNIKLYGESKENQRLSIMNELMDKSFDFTQIITCCRVKDVSDEANKERIFDESSRLIYKFSQL